MIYKNGSVISLGDKVMLMNGEKAEVVFISDCPDENPNFSKRDWDNIGDGILVKTEKGALVQYGFDDSDEFWKID